jgi:succinoglycan biosynthesis transport protein ExoP
MRETYAQIPVNSSGSDISARDVVAPLFRQKRILIVTFFCVFVAVTLLALVKGSSYNSHMAILVNRERLDPLVSTEATTQMVTGANPVMPEEVNSEVELLTSRDVLEQVARANGLDQPSTGFSLTRWMHPNRTEQDRLASAVKALAKGIKTQVTTKTNIIEVSYTSKDPQLAYGVLKSLGQFYTAKHVAVNHPAGTYTFFAGETQKYKDQLDGAETKLRDFARKNGIAAPDVQRTNMAQQVANSIGVQHTAEQAIAADEERIRNDREQMAATPQRSPTTQATATADKLLDNLNATLLAAETKRTQLALKYDANYPLVQEADQEIAQTKTAIAQAQSTRYVTESTDRDPTFELLREDLARAQADLAAQRANLAATKRSVQNLQGEVVNLDQKAITQQGLMREAKADENNYLLYLSKREQERTTDAMDATQIGNVAIAVPPAIPVLPIYPLSVILMISFGLAIVLSIGTAYAMDHFDSSFHTPTQVVDMLGVPVVITIPKKTA